MYRKNILKKDNFKFSNIKKLLLSLSLGIFTLNAFSQITLPTYLELPISDDVEFINPFSFYHLSLTQIDTAITKPHSQIKGTQFWITRPLNVTTSKVGIGTNSPEERLHVVGDQLLTGSLTVGRSSHTSFTQEKIKLMIGNLWTFSDLEKAKIMGFNYKTWDKNNQETRLETGASSVLKLNKDGSIQLGTAPTGSVGVAYLNFNYFTMLNDGKVGIGLTQPNFKLDVNGDANFTGKGIGGSSSYSNFIQLGDMVKFGGYSNTCLFGYNWEIDKFDADRRIKSGNASCIYLEGDRIHFLSAPYGAAGSIINYSSVVVHQGRLGIGNGSPLYNPEEALDVRGNSYISGYLGIGTTEMGGYKLRVNGKINCTELVVQATIPNGNGGNSEEWPDYVFTDDYELRSLDELTSYIQENQRLPEMPSATEVSENGINVGTMNALLLKKVEELTLYILDLQKQINEVKK